MPWAFYINGDITIDGQSNPITISNFNYDSINDDNYYFLGLINLGNSITTTIQNLTINTTNSYNNSSSLSSHSFNSSPTLLLWKIK